MDPGIRRTRGRRPSPLLVAARHGQSTCVAGTRVLDWTSDCGQQRDVLKILLHFLLGTMAVVGAVAGVLVSPWWWAAATPLLVLASVAIHDLVQRRPSVLRNYPLLGHLRFALEALRPELQQYFIERNFDGRPFDRDSAASSMGAPRARMRKSRSAPSLIRTGPGTSTSPRRWPHGRCSPTHPASGSADPTAPGPTTWPCSTSLGDELRFAVLQGDTRPQHRRRAGRLRRRHQRGRSAEPGFRAQRRLARNTPT